MELLAVLAALDDPALHALAVRFAVPIDTRKRLALADQLARGLVVSPRRSRLERWPEDLAEAVRLLLAAPRGLPVASLPRSALEHAGQGLLFKDPAHPGRLVIPRRCACSSRLRPPTAHAPRGCCSRASPKTRGASSASIT